jgi:hypothetical protein
MREAIEAIVKAMTGEKHAVETQKRHGYWYAKCGDYASGKGIGGPDGESYAVEQLRKAVREGAMRTVRKIRDSELDALRANRRVVDECENVRRAREVLETAERRLGEAREQASVERELASASKSQATPRELATLAALRECGIITDFGAQKPPKPQGE